MRPTLHRSLPAELQLMPFNLRLMEMIGLRGSRSNCYRFWLAYGWAFFIIALPKLVLGMGSTEIDAIIKGLSEFLFQSNLLVVMVIILLNMTSFERTLQLLSEIIRDVTAEDQPRDCYDLIRQQNSKINKFSKFYIFYCCAGPFVYWVPAMTTSCLRYFSVRNGSEPVQFELAMEQEFYGLQIRTNFAHYHLFMACSLLAYYINSYFLVIQGLTLLLLIKYSALTYQLVTLRIRRVAELSTDASVSTSPKVTATIEVVQLHNKALQITDLVEKIVNIPLGLQFLGCAMFWCFIMFYVTNNIDSSLINVMVVFLLSLAETYGYAYLGTELTESAAAVGDAIYDLHWYNESAQLQRYYRLILQRSQRETGVTAAKFFIVGREKFMNVVNKSYSFYLVLKDALRKL